MHTAHLHSAERRERGEGGLACAASVPGSGRSVDTYEQHVDNMKEVRFVGPSNVRHGGFEDIYILEELTFSI